MPRIKESERQEIQFFGGVGGLVTGSCSRVDFGDSGVLVDYGLFQGRYEERSSRGERPNLTPVRDIVRGAQDVLVTHAHIDHTGRIPMAFRADFTPNILVTENTAVFMELLLRNSAQIQTSKDPHECLYTADDVGKTLRHLKIVEPFSRAHIGQKHSKATAEFLPNGHVMGANSIFVRLNGHNVLFTGDMGKPQQSLCGGYLEHASSYPDDPVHSLVVESTNADRAPVSFDEKRANLLSGIQATWDKGGNPLLPTLSFHRLQEIIEILANSQREGLIPADCRFIIDAPLGVSILEAFQRLRPDQLSKRYGDDPDYYKTDRESMARFNLRNVEIVDSHTASVQKDIDMASYRGKSIIIASGGMAEHGRAVNYLRGKFCQNPKNAVLFTCYQVDGTNGSRLLQSGGAPRGGALVAKIDGFTSHISGPEMFDFLGRFNLRDLDTVFITHGNNQARNKLAREFRARDYSGKIVLPDLYQRATL